jgi:mycofactocin precursor peptide peptidase
MTGALADATWPEAERRAAGALLAVPVGSTEQHGPHLPLSTDTDIAVALVCAHGGNRAPVERAERRLRAEGRRVRAFFPVWSGDAHAGRAETSLMLALHPDRVRASLAEPGATAPLAELMPRLVAHGVRPVSPNGVLGDPSGAGAAEGWRLLDQTVDELAGAIEGWSAGPA